MNLLSKSIFTIIVATVSAIANAADSTQASPNEVVTRHTSAVSPASLNCTPPQYSKECSAFHAEIRRHFTAREIAALFGSTAALPEFSNSYSQVRSRYDAFVQDYSQRNPDAFAAK